MYVRWVVRRHKNATTADVVFHDAYLVESYRDEKATPRQRMICYLGNIRLMEGDFPAIERELFLLRAERILAATPEVPADERANMIALLHRTVPPLSDAELARAFRANIGWYINALRQRGTGLSRQDIEELLNDAPDNAGPM